MRSIAMSALLMMLVISTGYAGDLWLPLGKSTIITCDFCCYKFKNGVCHNGIDFGIPNNTVIIAASGGIVVKIDNSDGSKGYGSFIKIKHPNGYWTIYAHLHGTTVSVKEGDEVIAGQMIALSDNSGFSTGPHLHFEVRDPSGKKVDPYGSPPDYVNGCGLNALWAVCPPIPYDSSFDDKDQDGYIVVQGDCNDNDPNIHPGAKEFCDHLDNNCNGQTDEDWKKDMATHLGYPCTVGFGECQQSGSLLCSLDGLVTVCSVDAKPASQEICDGKDNDCDQQTDEDWQIGLASDLGQSCFVGQGPCQNQGQMVCTADGKATVCSVDVLPPNCEGKECGDDNCGGSCGECTCNELCKDYQCEWICKYKECGDNGCGGSCGECGSWEVCTSWGCKSVKGTICCSDDECQSGVCAGGGWSCLYAPYSTCQ